MSDRNTILMESIKRLLRRNALSHLRKIVAKTHAADLSRVFNSLSLTEQHKLFSLIEDIEQKGVLFSELEEDTLLSFVEALKIEDVVAVLEDMPTDDVADIIGKLPEETADAILHKMRVEGSEEIEGLLRYEGASGCGDALLSLCHQ